MGSLSSVSETYILNIATQLNTNLDPMKESSFARYLGKAFGCDLFGADSSGLDAPAEFWDVLSDEEKQQANRFVEVQDSVVFVTRRATLRILLSEQLGIGPQDLMFARSEYGKPFVVNGNCNFSVSSSRGAILIGLSARQPVGVDLEFIDAEFDFSGLIADVEPGSSTSEVFFRQWTLKEAKLKAAGVGIAHLSPVGDHIQAVGVQFGAGYAAACAWLTR